MAGQDERLRISRRAFLGVAATAIALPITGGSRVQAIEIIEAPSNLGLRPLREGHIPGTWRAPEALRRAGLHDRLMPGLVHRLERPPYDLNPQPGTRIRNGRTIRRYSEELARRVSQTLASGKAPIVIGGDCSILLGCLLGARRSGRCGLIHVDGHSDFFHPGNYDTSVHLGLLHPRDRGSAFHRAGSGHLSEGFLRIELTRLTNSRSSSNSASDRCLSWCSVMGCHFTGTSHPREGFLRTELTRLTDFPFRLRFCLGSPLVLSSFMG